MRGPIGSHRQRRHDDGDDAGNMEIPVGQDEAQVTEAHRHRSNGGVRLAQPRQDHHRTARHDETQQQPANEFAQEHRDRTGRVARDLRRQGIAGRTRYQDPDEQAEGGDGNRIVQERLAFGQDRQPLGRSDVTEDADDRGWVGRRDDSAEQQADHDIDPCGQMDDTGHASDAHQDRHDGQQQHGMDLVQQASHVDCQASGEQQRRQKQRQENIGADLELVEADEGVAQRPQLHIDGKYP